MSVQSPKRKAPDCSKGLATAGVHPPRRIVRLCWPAACACQRPAVLAWNGSFAARERKQTHDRAVRDFEKWCAARGLTVEFGD